jgi:rare lipoprotein A
MRLTHARGEGMRAFFRVALGTAFVIALLNNVRAATASIYGGADGLCGHKTANGERLNCTALTAAHRKLAFGTLVRVCHDGCVTVRINDRGPWIKGRDIDLSPAAGRAIGLYKTGHVTLSVDR